MKTEGSVTQGSPTRFCWPPRYSQLQVGLTAASAARQERLSFPFINSCDQDANFYFHMPDDEQRRSKVDFSSKTVESWAWCGDVGWVTSPDMCRGVNELLCLEGEMLKMRIVRVNNKRLIRTTHNMTKPQAPDQSIQRFILILPHPNELICISDHVLTFLFLPGSQHVSTRQGLPGRKPVHLSWYSHVLWNPTTHSKFKYLSVYHPLKSDMTRFD